VDVRSAPPVDLSMLLNQASHALAVRLGGALKGIGISVRVYCVLVKAYGEERTQVELAQAAYLDKTTMVATLDEMERLGLAERRLSPTDRRVRKIVLTRKGEQVLDRADAIVTRTYDELFGDVPAKDRESFLAVLKQLVEGPLATPFHLDGPAVRRRRAA
jgi:MarR family transcriptional regulator for hemolysin